MAGKRLLIVDATNNKEGFEHAVTNYLAAVAQYATLSVVGGKAHFVYGLSEYCDAFNNNQDYDALLLFAHGWGAGKEDVAGIDIGDEVTNWYLAASAMHVHQKHIFLVVCSGYNEDSIDALFREQHPGVVVGSVCFLFKNRVVPFYQQLLGHLGETGFSDQSIRSNVAMVLMDYPDLQKIIRIY